MVDWFWPLTHVLHVETIKKNGDQTKLIYMPRNRSWTISFRKGIFSLNAMELWINLDGSMQTAFFNIFHDRNVCVLFDMVLNIKSWSWVSPWVIICCPNVGEYFRKRGRPPLMHDLAYMNIFVYICIYITYDICGKDIKFASPHETTGNRQVHLEM